MKAAPRPFVGIAVIVVRNRRVLLGKRKNAHGAGTWQFPGGHLEYGESVSACARRELLEETGMTLGKFRRGPYTNDFFEAEQKHYVTIFVIAEQVSGTPELREPHKCEQWGWFEWKQMPKPYFLPIVNLLRQNFSVATKPSPADPIKAQMALMVDIDRARVQQRFFKTEAGGYGEGDVFLGIRVPVLRKLAVRHRGVDLAAIGDLLQSPIHEHRHLALLLLIDRFQQADGKERRSIADIYLNHTRSVNNWDLVDCSAPAILGDFLMGRDRSVLFTLARSAHLWERRIAMVATLHFIRAGQLEDTLRLAAILIEDGEPLIHTAVGWMLREVGKRDETALISFLKAHHRQLPRTMLRCAIERFPAARRRSWLADRLDRNPDR